MKTLEKKHFLNSEASTKEIGAAKDATPNRQSIKISSST